MNRKIKGMLVAVVLLIVFYMAGRPFVSVVLEPDFFALSTRISEQNKFEPFFVYRFDRWFEDWMVEMYILVSILLLVVMIFGVVSGMQSFATAKQAQATIEVAQVAQVNAWGNLIVILVMALLIMAVLAIIVWMVYRSLIAENGKIKPIRGQQTPISHQPQFSMSDLVWLKMLEVLSSMSGNKPNQALSLMDSREEAVEEPLHWLR